MAISRRQFVFGLSAASIISPFLIASESSARKITRESVANFNPVFQHGIASGDPMSDRVILWTRISSASQNSIAVNWEVAEDKEFNRIISRGETYTNVNRDFTVKIDASGLAADTDYYYRFKAINTLSAVGRTRTLPVGDVSELRFAVSSCSNYSEGYFNVYRLIANRKDINAVIHLGDYIYENNKGTHGSDPLPERQPLPDHEIISLNDYRQRHAQYKTDPDLQMAHQNHPFIMIWDDHEIANDAWRDGAGNHNPELGEGDWQTRKQAAMQAYFEWMPIRELTQGDSPSIYRSFAFGNLLDLVMLDTRIVGREQPDYELTHADNHSLLGATQESWLYDTLNYSKQMGTQWRMIGQQVMCGQLCPFGQTINFDQWDGYPESRNRFLETLQSNDINNNVLLTGDIHSSWANELSLDPYDDTKYDADTGLGSLAVEFVTPPISSEGISNSAQSTFLEQIINATNPHTKYVELSKRGYMLVDVTHERVKVDWLYTDTVLELSDVEYIGKSLQTLSHSNRISTVT